MTNEERQMWNDYIAAGRPTDMRNKLYDHFHGLVHFLAKRNRKKHPTLSMSEIIQEYGIQAIRAIEAFDPNRGLQFSALLNQCVFRHSVKVHHRETKAQRVRPIDIEKAYLEVDGNSPNFTVSGLLGCRKSNPLGRLPLTSDDHEHREMCGIARKALESVGGVRGEWMRRYFGGERQPHIAASCGVSHQRVSQQIKKAVEEARKYMAAYLQN